jgi:hypothetical protein
MISSVLKATRSATFKVHFDESHSPTMVVMLDTVSLGYCMPLTGSFSATSAPILGSITLEP